MCVCVGQQDSSRPEDEHRKFIISYYLSDDTMTIFEPPQRSAHPDTPLLHAALHVCPTQECGNSRRQVPGEDEGGQARQPS